MPDCFDIGSWWPYAKSTDTKIEGGLFYGKPSSENGGIAVPPFFLLKIPCLDPKGKDNFKSTPKNHIHDFVYFPFSLCIPRAFNQAGNISFSKVQFHIFRSYFFKRLNVLSGMEVFLIPSTRISAWHISRVWTMA